jgi:hypothetical protein
VVETDCFIDNPRNISLFAYPDHFYGWPFFPRLPVIPKVRKWEGHIVRGLPPDLVREMIIPFREYPHNIFSETYGFERLRVLGRRVRGRFVLDPEEKHRIIDITEGLALFSGQFN